MLFFGQKTLFARREEACWEALGCKKGFIARIFCFRHSGRERGQTLFAQMGESKLRLWDEIDKK